MAEAERTQIIEKVYSSGIKLTLTMDEAKTLYLLTQRVGGDVFSSPRKFADSVADALNGVLPSFRWGDSEYTAWSSRLDGHLLFDKDTNG